MSLLSLAWILGSRPLFAAQPAEAAPSAAPVDARAEVAEFLYAASATRAADQRAVVDEKIRMYRREIRRTDDPDLRLSFVWQLSDRDSVYRQEIAVLQSAAWALASTSEGAAALAVYNDGKEAPALARFDALTAPAGPPMARASERLWVAVLAQEAMQRGRLRVEDVAARFEEVTRLDPEMHQAWTPLVGLYQQLGRTADAEHARQRADATYDDEPRVRRLQAAADQVLWNEWDLDAATTTFRAALVIRERLARADPSSAGAQHDLIVAHCDLATVLLAQGMLDAALDHAEAALGLVDRPEADTVDIALAHYTAGEVLRAQGAMPAALDHARGALALAEGLAGADEANPDNLVRLILAHRQMTLVSLARGALDAALDHARAEQRTAEQLAEVRWVNPYWTDHLLANARADLGRVQLVQGDLGPALENTRAAVAIAERLAENQTSAGSRRTVAAHTAQMGEVLVAQRAFAAARDRFEAALTIFEPWALARPPNAAGHRDVALCAALMAEVTEHLGEDATVWWRRTYDLLRGLQDGGRLQRADDQALLADAAARLEHAQP